MCVVPKGSKNIWVIEKVADRNNIGEKHNLYVVPGWKLDGSLQHKCLLQDSTDFSVNLLFRAFLFL